MIGSAIISVSVNASPRIVWSSEKIEQGKTFQVKVYPGKPVKSGMVTFDGRTVPMSTVLDEQQAAMLRAFVGVDVRTRVGTHEITIVIDQEGEAVLPLLPKPTERLEFKESILILPGKFPVQRVKLPPKASKLLDPKLLKHDQDRLEVAIAEGDRIEKEKQSHLIEPFALPLSKYILTTRFGEHRVFNGMEFGFHRGLDMAAPTGTPVKAALPGTVVMSEKLYAHGHSIMIAHGEGVFTLYVHLSQRGVNVGDVVPRGRIIGNVGSTGISSGPHLHLGLIVHGVRVDPMQWMRREIP